jgi:hypothetical protein
MNTTSNFILTEKQAIELGHFLINACENDDHGEARISMIVKQAYSSGPWELVLYLADHEEGG